MHGKVSGDLNAQALGQCSIRGLEMQRLSRFHAAVPGFAVCALVVGCLGDRAAPARLQDLPGVWIGRSENHWGSMYRLELNGDGSGFLIVGADNIRPPHAHLYEITHWALDDGRFTCTLRQLAPQSHRVPLKIKGSATASTFLNLQLVEQDESGRSQSSELHMVTEGTFLEELERQRSAVQQLGARMQTYRSDKSWDGE
jgi:hypothetical protein